MQARSFGRMRALVRDIGIGGMHLEADAVLAIYEPVTIEFCFPHGSPVQRWQAMVVHSAKGSAGVVFEFLRTAELAKLIELLRAGDVHAQAAPRPSTGLRHGPAAGAPEYGKRVSRPSGAVASHGASISGRQPD
jgi:PilZ domain